MWLNGGARPSAEPLYSAGSREEFPIPLEYLKTSYTDLLSSELKNTDNLVISQSISDGQLTAIFAPDASFQPRPGLGWGTMSNLNDLMRFLQAEKLEGRHVFSLASEARFGFGVLTMEGYGTDQVFCTGFPSVVRFLKTTDRNFAISAVASWGSQFFFVLTEGVEMYAGKKQFITIRRGWMLIEEAIYEGWDMGAIITGLCFCTKTGQYALVMTESTAQQAYEWDWDSTQDFVANGYHPTLVLHHPPNDSILTVLTTDENRSGYTIRSKHPIYAW